MLYGLWCSPWSTPLVLAAAALTALAALAGTGNALSFTAVTAGAGLLAGLASARPLDDGAEGATGDCAEGGAAAVGAKTRARSRQP